MPVKQSISKTPEETTAENAEVIKSLLNYPSLEKVFEAADGRNLTATKEKMRLTIDDLERVIRRGTKDDAEKAAAAVKSFQTVLSFLDELESLRQANSK